MVFVNWLVNTAHIVVVVCLTFITLVNAFIFFTLMYNMAYLWRRKKEDLKEQGDYIAKRVTQTMMGEEEGKK